ncbi:hypothetical protein SAMN05444745_11116 [Arthrobacter sp. OV608]|nr:hypothetical protein SAMN05444745_11116 [Arthrobacter sp. OV608]
MKNAPWSDSDEDSGAAPEVPAVNTMIIRTWYEPSHDQGFRARITYSKTLDNSQNTVTTADSAEVLRVVQQWLSIQPGVSGRH